MFGWRLTTAELASLDALIDEDDGAGEQAAEEEEPSVDGSDLEVRFTLRTCDGLLLRLSAARPAFAGTASIFELVAVRERAAERE